MSTSPYVVTGLVDGTVFTHPSEPVIEALAEDVRRALEGGAVFATLHDLALAIGAKGNARLPATLFRMGVTGHVDEGPRANGPYRWRGCTCPDGAHGAAPARTTEPGEPAEVSGDGE